jgi:hypothetical protein
MENENKTANPAVPIPEKPGYEQCNHCNGFGSSFKDPVDVNTCTKCGGSGVTPIRQDTSKRMVVITECNHITAIYTTEDIEVLVYNYDPRDDDPLLIGRFDSATQPKTVANIFDQYGDCLGATPFNRNDPRYVEGDE